MSSLRVTKETKFRGGVYSILPGTLDLVDMAPSDTQRRIGMTNPTQYSEEAQRLSPAQLLLNQVLPNSIFVLLLLFVAIRYAIDSQVCAGVHQ